MQSSTDSAYWDRPPDRWLKCPRKSDIIVDRFIACKTPLKSKYDDQVPVEDRFTVDMLLQAVSRLNRRIGLWIDLTNTSRYYDREDIERAGIRYVKISCPGRDGPPEAPQVEVFIDACDKVQPQQPTIPTAAPLPMPLTVVHCTHGFNRTGFLISAYIVERLDADPSIAFDTFKRARPPGIYKGEYISEFFRRYCDEETPVPAAPERPSWHSAGTIIDYAAPVANGHLPALTLPHGNHRFPGNNATGTHTAASGTADPQPNGTTAMSALLDAVDVVDAEQQMNGDDTSALAEGFHAPPAAVFMEGKVPGVVQVTDAKELFKLKLLVIDYCYGRSKDDPESLSANPAKARKIRFPGSQPVSMDIKNINNLHTDYYRVSWKADGVRYMMLIREQNVIYMIDREFNFFRVPYMEFPSRKNPDQHLYNTLLDGEMIMDDVKDPVTGAKRGTRPRYLIYDIVHFGEERVGLCNFDIRMTCIKKEVVGPRKEYAAKSSQFTAQDPFSVMHKEFGDVFTAKKILGDFSKNLTHETDGLLFQPWKDAYKPGTCDRILKWKPPHLNSIDFRVKLKRPPPRTGMLPELLAELWVLGKETPFHVVPVKGMLNSLRSLDGKIVELSIVKADNKQMQWKFLRERTDKTAPNAWKTAEAVWQSIENPVNQEALIKYIERFGKRHVPGSSSKTAVPSANGNGVKHEAIAASPDTSAKPYQNGKRTKSDDEFDDADTKRIRPDQLPPTLVPMTME